MTFGERLRALREAAGLSQEALARAAGLSTSSISKMEQRNIDPSWTTVQALAAALGVSCEVFQDGGAQDLEPPPAKGRTAGDQAGKDKPAGKGRGRKGGKSS